MKVEVLYFDGCPSHERLLPRLCELIEQAGVIADLELRPVESLEAAEAERFLGSPTIRVDGHDVEPGAGDRRDYGLKCRLYLVAGKLRGTPPETYVLATLAEANAKGHADADRAA
jgi:hypothetical protein